MSIFVYYMEKTVLSDDLIEELRKSPDLNALNLSI